MDFEVRYRTAINPTFAEFASRAHRAATRGFTRLAFGDKRLRSGASTVPMGITINAAEFLLQCRAEGVSPSTTPSRWARQGRLRRPAGLDRLFKGTAHKAGFSTKNFKETRMPFADKLFVQRGRWGRAVDSMRVSGITKARPFFTTSTIHPRTRGKVATAPLAGGGILLEHIFFFPDRSEGCGGM